VETEICHAQCDVFRRNARIPGEFLPAVSNLFDTVPARREWSAGTPDLLDLFENIVVVENGNVCRFSYPALSQA